MFALLSFICGHVPSIHPLWLTGVGHWYLPIEKELPSLCREYDGEELPAELTRTGKLRFADECKIIHDTRRRRRRLYNQRYFISMDSDCGYQITCTLPYHSGDEETKGKNEISKQVLMI